MSAMSQLRKLWSTITLAADEPGGEALDEFADDDEGRLLFGGPPAPAAAAELPPALDLAQQRDAEVVQAAEAGEELLGELVAAEEEGDLLGDAVEAGVKEPLPERPALRLVKAEPAEDEPPPPAEEEAPAEEPSVETGAEAGPAAAQESPLHTVAASGGDSDDPMAMFRAATVESAYGHLTQEFEETPAGDLLAELREVRAMLPPGPSEQGEASA